MGRSNYRGILATAILLVVVTVIAVSLVIWRLRQDTIDEAIRETSNIATILAAQVSHSAQSIELVLDDVAAEVRRRGVDAPADVRDKLQDRAVQAYLKERLARLPQADVLTLTDATGRVIAITRAWPTPVVDLSDRDYFRHLSTVRDGATFVSEPVRNKITATWTTYFARRLETADGRFLGVALIGVRPEFFMSALDAVSAIPGRSLVLLRSDGTVLQRHPARSDRTVTRLPSHSAWYGMRETGGHFRSTGVFSDHAHWVVVHPIANTPLVMNVGITEESALAPWRLRATTIVGSSVVVAAILIALLSLLFRQIRRLHGSEAQLAEKSRQIGLANARFDATLTSMSHGIAMFDRAGRLVIHNRKYEEIWGLCGDELRPGTPWATIRAACPACDPGTGDADESPIDTCCSVLAEARHHVGTRELPDGRFIRTTVDPMPDGGWVTTHEDITATQRAQARIAHMAHYDALTELANRTLFMRRIHEATTAPDTAVRAVLLLDLDRFKEVNDGYGHAVGDRLLCAVAARLRTAVRSGDLVARLGGDEFAIVCPLDETRIEGLEHMTDRLLATVSAPYTIDGHDLAVGVSIGISLIDPGFGDPERVVRQADLALYRAKSGGRNRWRVFEPAMEEEYRARQTLTIDLQAAICRDELEIHYQPIVDAASLEIRTMEALVRWNHRELGWVPPSHFIPVAEEAGLIQALGDRVLGRACVEAKAWPASIRLAVNVSTLQIAQSSFPDTVGRILRESGLPPERLQLEITESVLLADAARAVAILDALHQMGVSIVLDDFGTGYSSLSYLKRFPFDEVKIDKSFVDDIVGHRGCAAIVSATIALAREFDMVTTAEGVETREQYELLRATAVTQMQGWLFGRPAPAAAWNLAAAQTTIVLPPAAAIDAPARDDVRAIERG